jgi:RHS repeat-associated protein
MSAAAPERQDNHNKIRRGSQMKPSMRILTATVGRALLGLRSLLVAALLLPALAAQAQSASTTTLSVTPNPSVYAQSITLTATVTGASPTGNVSFMDGAATLGTGTLSAGVATLAVNTLAVGSHSLTAAYGGDAGNAASTSSALTQTVNKVSTTSTVTSSAVTLYYGQNFTWTATVNGNAPDGLVTFRDYGNAMGTASLTGTGNTRTAVYSGTLPVGTHVVTVAYGGNATNNTSTSANGIYQETIKYPTTTALASSLNPSTYGQGVTWTASVSGNGTPTGIITFKDGSAVLGTATMAAGTASFSSSTVTGGVHSMTAVYAGDAGNNTSTSAALSQTVNKLATSTALAVSVNPSVGGQLATLTATVTGSTPIGSVTFKDGAATLGTAALSAGASSFATRFTGGSHSVTAVYGGDINNATSTSSTLTQSVSLVTSTTTLSVTPSPASVGQNVTLMARVGGYSPSGMVTFTDGGTPVGTASVSAGAATLSLNSLAQGSHTLAASYAGDPNNTASSASGVSATVNARSAMTWQYGYDAMGRLNTTVDPNGLASYIYYDSLGRPVQTQQPPNTGSSTPTVIQLGYNLADGLTSVTDPRNLATSYSPNGLGDVASQSSPDTATSTFSYDAKGNLLTSLDARGKQTGYGYDNLDRLTSISYPSGTGTTFEYDGGASPTPAEKGELTKMTDESGQTVYSHDALGRLTTKITVIGSRTFSTGYSWGDSGSALDKLTAITYPSGSRVNYSYDAQGAVSAISVNPVNANGGGVSGTAQALLGTITYNVDNNITGWLWSDGKARTIGYDSVGLISSYTLGDPAGTGSAAGTLRSVSRDSAGRITGYSHVNSGSAVASLEQTFGYDNLNRLLSASLNGAGTAYSYDETGNRTSKTIGATTYSNTVATTSNRLTQTQDVGGTATITYDAAGHITGDGTNSFTYSDRGRMVSASTPSGTVTYVYNGLNQRVGKSGSTTLVPTGAAYYLYDEAGQLLGEYDANGAPIYETIYLGALPVGAIKQTGTAATSDIAVTLYNVHADHIATARVITKQDQTIVWRWDSAEAFGATAPDQNPNSLGTFSFNQRFPGQVFDAETGLFQNWNREYNARQGRYIESDPIGLAGGINSFAYVKSNPLSAIDPRGENIVGAVLMRVATFVGGYALYDAYQANTPDPKDCDCAEKLKKAQNILDRLQQMFPDRYKKRLSVGVRDIPIGGVTYITRDDRIFISSEYCSGKYQLSDLDLADTVAHEALHANDSWYRRIGTFIGSEFDAGSYHSRVGEQGTRDATAAMGKR